MGIRRRGREEERREERVGEIGGFQGGQNRSNGNRPIGVVTIITNANGFVKNTPQKHLFYPQHAIS